MQENAGISKTTTRVEPYKKAAFDLYLTFCALGGMIVSDTGGIKPLTLGDFCRSVGVDEETTRRWKKNTPDFAMKVRARRDEITPLARETAAFNRLFLIGMSSLPTQTKDLIDPATGKVKTIRTGQLHSDQRSAVDALKTYTGHFSNLRLPVQRQDIKVEGSLADIFTKAEKEIVEGEVVNADRPTASLPGTPAVPPEA